MGGNEGRRGLKQVKGAKSPAPTDIVPPEMATEMEAARPDAAPAAQRARGDSDKGGQAYGSVVDKGTVDTHQDAMAQGKRERTPLDELLPLPSSTLTKHCKMHESAQGGARDVGGSAARTVAKTAGREVTGVEGGVAEGEAVKASTIKVEPYDRSYDCAVCFESVHSNAAVMQCSHWQCSVNPFH